MASKAIPTHLRAQADTGFGEGGQRHHGKSQSHMVSLRVEGASRPI